MNLKISKIIVSLAFVTFSATVALSAGPPAESKYELTIPGGLKRTLVLFTKGSEDGFEVNLGDLLKSMKFKRSNSRFEAEIPVNKTSFYSPDRQIWLYCDRKTLPIKTKFLSLSAYTFDTIESGGG